MASVSIRSFAVASRQMSPKPTHRTTLANSTMVNAQKNGQFPSTSVAGDSPSLRRFSSKKFVHEGSDKSSVEFLLSKTLGDSPLAKNAQEILRSYGISSINQLKSLNRVQLEKIGLVNTVIDAIQSFKGHNEVHISGAVPIPEKTVIIKVPSGDGKPQAAVSEFAYEGSKNPFISKTNEQFWKDLENNAQETLWMRSEQASGESLEWYQEWKAENPIKYESTGIRPIMQIDPTLMRPQPIGVIPDSNSIKIRSNSMDHELSDHKSYIMKRGEHFGVKCLDDWYNVNIIDFKESDSLASEFLMHYQNSLIRALISLFPEHNWQVWKFDCSYKGFQNIENQVDSDSTSHNPYEEDWNTTMDRYKDHWQVTMFSTTKGNSIANVASPFTRIKNTSTNVDSGIYQKQQELSSVVSQLFPKSEIINDYVNPSLVYSDTKRPFSLGCYLPEHKIAFEVIEDPNFSWQYSFGADIPIYTFNKAKRAICEKQGITVIQVPSWWDSKSSSSHLVNAVKRVRPDIILASQKQEIQAKSSVAQSMKDDSNINETEKEEKEEKESHIDRV